MAAETINQNKTSTRNHWLIFLVSLVAITLLLIFLPSWFWVALPFLLTSFVYGMRWV